MELIGTIKSLPELQTFASGFQKRECVLVTDETYPQPINIEFLSDKIDLLNTVKEGDKVKISINIRGRSWTSPQGETKYFNSITGWKIESVGTVADTHIAKPYSETPKPDLLDDDSDSLPF